MLVLSANKRYPTKIGVGSYTAVVTNVCYEESYADREAFRIDYELTNEFGEKYGYSEIFHNLASNARTAQFFKYLSAAGIQEREDELPNLVGFTERVVLKRRAGYSKPLIVERNPV